MAVNNRNRRASVFAGGLLFRVVYPIPDGTIGAGDRQQLLGLYRFAVDAQSGGGEAGGTFTPIAVLLADTFTPIAVFIEVDTPVAILL